jgi:hypothetical protein
MQIKLFSVITKGKINRMLIEEIKGKPTSGNYVKLVTLTLQTWAFMSLFMKSNNDLQHEGILM